MRSLFAWPPALMSAEEAAYYVGVSLRTFNDLTSRGVLIAQRNGPKRGFLRDELDRYLATLPEWDGKGARPEHERDTA